MWPRFSKARSMVAQPRLRSVFTFRRLLSPRKPAEFVIFMHQELGCPRVLASRAEMPCVGMIGLPGYLDERKTFDIKNYEFHESL